MRQMILYVLNFLGIALSSIVGTNPNNGSCLCVSTSVLNIRNSACGSLIGQGYQDECFTYMGDKKTCDLGGTNYEFFKFDYYNRDGWAAGDYLDLSDNNLCVTGTPNKEFRSVWVATVSNIDWPTSAGLPTTDQQTELLAILNQMQELNMNALVFQVRPAGDAFYNSSLEPWSRWLTGVQGLAPDPLWDPMAFAVTEGHRRNIEVHVWLNPYRANTAPTWDGLAPNHMANRFREHAHAYGNYLWMDPAAQVVQDHLIAVITDIVNRYDVDGIHYDDYFYPYPVEGVDFPDDQTYADYLASGGTLGRADWRRDNVNKMVERSYATIKSLKKQVKFGIAPFGIYRPGHPDGMPAPIIGFDQYEKLYADPKLWLQNGWLDYLAPQLYWRIDPPAQSYPTLLGWWLDVNTQKRHVYAGNAVYKMYNEDWSVTEITNQVEISRQAQNRQSLGNVFFSYKWFRQNYKNIADVFKSTIYSSPAQIPEMPWLLSGQMIETPTNLYVNGDLVSWDKDVKNVVWKWAVYRRVGRKLTLQHLLQAENTSIRVTPGSYVIYAQDRVGCNSNPMPVQVNLIKTISG